MPFSHSLIPKHTFSHRRGTQVLADVQGNLSSEKLTVPAENWDVKPGDTIVIPGDQEKTYEVLKVAFQPKTGQLIPASYSVELRFIP